MIAGDAQAPEGGGHSCPQCGEPLAPKAAFCRSCGAKVAPSCGECGATLAANSAFCRACGSPIGAGSPRSKTPFLVGALVLLVGAGVAVAIVASKSSSASKPTTTVERVGIADPEASNEEEPGGEMVEAEEEPVEAEEAVSSSGFPEVERSQMNEEIASLLQDYHEDVVEEDFRGAWAMLSPRKRRQYLREYGYHTWATAQASLSSYLDPYGLEANVVSLEAARRA